MRGILLRRKKTWLLFGAIAALIAICSAVTAKIRPEEANAADPSLSSPWSMNYTHGWDASGNNIGNQTPYYTNDFTINGKRAWCADSSKDTPKKGSYADQYVNIVDYPTSSVMYTRLFRAMYFGEKGGYHDVAIHNVVNAIKQNGESAMGNPFSSSGAPNSYTLMKKVLDTNNYIVPNNVTGHVYMLNAGKRDAGKQSLVTYDYTEEEIDTYLDIYKKWIDANREDRPTQVTVKIVDASDHDIVYRSGITIGESDGWYKRVDGLPVDKTFDVIEDNPAPGYTPSYYCNTENTACTVYNRYSGTVDVRILKHWEEHGYAANRPSKITFHVVGTLNGQEVYNKDHTFVVIKNYSSNTYSISDLPGVEGNDVVQYTVTETIDYNDPDNASTIYYYTFSGDTSGEMTADTETLEFEFTNELEYISVPVKKIWDDKNSAGVAYTKRPTAVDIRVFRNGVYYNTYTFSCMLTNQCDDDEWNFSLSLPKTDKSGQDIAYTFEEATVSDYKSEVTANSTSGFTVKNTHEYVSISIEKNWEDLENEWGERPESVEFRVRHTVNRYIYIEAQDIWQFQGGVVEAFVYDGEHSTVTLTENNDAVEGDYCYGKKWCFEIKDLPKYDLLGTEIMYDFFETPNSGVYESGDTTSYQLGSVQLDNSASDGNHYRYVATNRAYTSVKVIKCWDDEKREDNRPDSMNFIINQHSANIDEDHTITLTSEDENPNTGCWTKTINSFSNGSSGIPNLPIYDSEGEEITYSVKEDETTFEGDVVYEPSRSSCTFTVNNGNTCYFVNKRLINITVKKVWVGDDEEDRPKTVTVSLYQDGEVYDEDIVLSADTGWEYTWDNLDYDYEWTLTENIRVEGYEKADIVYETDENGNLIIYVYNTKSPDTSDKGIARYMFMVSGVLLSGLAISRKFLARR